MARPVPVRVIAQAETVIEVLASNSGPVRLVPTGLKVVARPGTRVRYDVSYQNAGSRQAPGQRSCCDSLEQRLFHAFHRRRTLRDGRFHPECLAVMIPPRPT